MGPVGEMTAIERAVARGEIQQLVFAYADAVDRRDLDLLASLYRPDARFGEFGDGAPGARAFFAESLSRIGIAVLLVANHQIEFDPGTTERGGGCDRLEARGTVWTHGFIDDAEEGFIQQLIKYEDLYVRIDGEWKFTRRRHLLWLGWRHDEPDPLAQQPADWPDKQTGLGSVPYDDGHWQRFWTPTQARRAAARHPGSAPRASAAGFQSRDPHRST